MKFNEWIQKQGQYVYYVRVLNYLKRKTDSKAKEVIKEIRENCGRGKSVWIPSACYKDEYYSF